MKLAEAQAVFADLIAGRPGASAAALACLVAAPGHSPQRGLDIYLETIRQKTVQRLGVAFARVARLAGAEAFVGIVAAHVRECPPAARTHHELMVRLPAFLSAHPLAAGRPDLGDLARLELARADVAVDESREPAGVGALARLDPAGCGRATLRLVPALRLLHLAHDISPLWQDLAEGASPSAPLPLATALLVWRSGRAVFHARLQPEEAAALECALAGATLSEVCEAFSAREDAADAAYAALHGWFARGLVLAVQP